MERAPTPFYPWPGFCLSMRIQAPDPQPLFLEAHGTFEEGIKASRGQLPS